MKLSPITELYFCRRGNFLRMAVDCQDHVRCGWGLIWFFNQLEIFVPGAVLYQCFVSGIAMLHHEDEMRFRSPRSTSWLYVLPCCWWKGVSDNQWTMADIKTFFSYRSCHQKIEIPNSELVEGCFLNLQHANLALLPWRWNEILFLRPLQPRESSIGVWQVNFFMSYSQAIFHLYTIR